MSLVRVVMLHTYGAELTILLLNVLHLESQCILV